MHHLSTFQWFWIAFVWILCLGAIYLMVARFAYEELKVLAGAVRSEYSYRRQRKRTTQELEELHRLPAPDKTLV